MRYKKDYEINVRHSIPLINNLEIREIFKDKNKEEEVGILDFIKGIVWIVKRDLD